MKVLAGNLKQFAAVKDAQGSCKALSKVLTVGTKYRLFFPLTTDENGEKELLLATVPGRKINYDKIKRSFISLDDFDQTDSGRIIDNSGLQPWARISRVIYDAECKRAIEAAKNEAKTTADQTGQDVDQIALSQKIREIELAYNGDPDAKPQAVYATESPLLGRVILEAATEVLVVPLTAEGAPEWSKAVVASFALSSSKATKLTELINNKDYCQADSKYLEVGYAYVGTDKKDAGRNATLQGCSKDTALATKYPESWEANQNVFERLSKTPEGIAAKNMSMSSNTTAKEVVELIKKYLSKNALSLVHIDFESDIVKASAKDFIELGIVDNVSTVRNRLLDIVNTQASTVEDDSEDVNAEELAAAAKATSLTELMNATGDLDKLTGGEELADSDISEI